MPWAVPERVRERAGLKGAWNASSITAQAAKPGIHGHRQRMPCARIWSRLRERGNTRRVAAASCLDRVAIGRYSCLYASMRPPMLSARSVPERQNGASDAGLRDDAR
jgi:hypothetical protein